MTLDNEHIQLPELMSWGDASWRAHAACKGADTAVFFPEKGPLSVVHASLSKSYCMGCSVKLPCLKFAVENHITVGTYGGYSPSDRRGMVLEKLDDDTVRVSLSEGFAILKRAKDPSPIATLSRLVGETEEWVEDGLANGIDYRF